MTASQSPGKVARWLWYAGFFTATWDLLGNVDWHGFTFKVYQPFFALCFLVTAHQVITEKGLREYLRPLRAPFPLLFSALGTIYLLSAPWSVFPLKSALYAGWLLLDVALIWLSFQHLSPGISRRSIARLISVSSGFMAGVILIDHLSYLLGRRQGVIGYNQDVLTNIGVSRPHAFSSEPSFAASFLCLSLLTAFLGILLTARPKKKPFAVIWGLLGLFALIVTASRTGWFGLAIGLGLLFLLPLLTGKKLPWKAIGGTALAVPLLAGLFYLLTPARQLEALNVSLVGSILKGYDSSGSARLKAHVLAYEFARDTHWLGTGLGASYRWFKDHGGFDYNYQEPFNIRMWGNELIMSSWGQLLAEGGLWAPLLFLLAALSMLRALRARWRLDEDPFTLGCLTASLVFFSFMAFWLGNVCRGDIWIWYSIWSAVAAGTIRSESPPGAPGS